MSLRERSGNWHYRFKVGGHTWTGDTGLAATERNRNAAERKEADAYKQVVEGGGAQLHVTVAPFSESADQFIEWAKGEYREKPNTWKRLRGSMTALKAFFQRQPLHTINTAGQIMDYMAWRRRETQQQKPVKDVTIRHDIHAASLLFKYGVAHGWCRSNPATSDNLEAHGTKMPSDADAVRMHVLTKVRRSGTSTDARCRQ